MRIGVLGTGAVGQAIASKLIALGHEVRMGAREAGNGVAAEWVAHCAPLSSAGTFAEAAEFGTFSFLCTNGAGAVAAATSAAEGLAGKLLIDVTNPLDFSSGTPTLFVGITDSLGEQVQRAVPAARVVKALNTMNNAVMVDPSSVPGEHVVFVAGDDVAAKAQTVAVLSQFGWTDARVVDAGDITGARATEAYILLWLKLARPGASQLNIVVERSQAR